jgi:hypothetical protein
LDTFVYVSFARWAAAAAAAAVRRSTKAAIPRSAQATLVTYVSTEAKSVATTALSPTARSLPYHAH